MTATIRRPLALGLSALLILTLLMLAIPSEAGFPGENGPLVYSDGTYVNTVNADGTGKKTTPVGNMVGFDVSPDGTKVVGAMSSDGSGVGPIVIVELATGAQQEIAASGTSAAFSGDGNRVAYAGESGLFVRDLGTGMSEPINADVNHVFDWSPVDNRVLVTRNVSNGGFPEVYLETIDVETGSSTTIRDNGPGLFTGFAAGGDFSPDGESVVYTWFTPGVTELYVTGQASPIAEGDAISQLRGPATWSPDGTRVAYARSTVEGEVITVHTLNSGAESHFAALAEAIDWARVGPTTPGDETPDFEDVPSSHVFYDDIVWLAEQGITRGCNPPENTEFCPDDNVTRGQMAAFLVRALDYTDPGAGDLFDDDNGHVFEGDIDRLATAGVTRGCNPPANTNFCPDDNVTRGQMAAFLHRALGD